MMSQGTLALLALLQVHPVAQVDSIVQSGIESGVYPGAVMAIGTADTVLRLRGFGGLTWRDTSARVDPDSTLYDLASLTKVVATTAALMRLVGTDRVTLDARVADYVPDFVGEDKASITIRHLLNHSTGLRAFLPLNDRASDAAEARRLVVTEQLRRPPGRLAEYSDLNAMLAGWVVEGVTGMSLDAFVRDSVHGPLGMGQTQYRVARRDRHRAAPINRWRGHPIAGVVHDQNAEVLGGVAGHAGLYANGRDMAQFARVVLASHRGSGEAAWFDSATTRVFLDRQAGNRALGFEANDTTSSGHTGDSLSARAVGHGGYTGSSIWIDPERNLYVILLTNRVYAPRTRGSIAALRNLRAALADGAVRLQNYYCRVLPDPLDRTRVGCRN